MAQSLVPRDGGDFKAALATLATNFSLSSEVTKRIESEGVTHLEDFCLTMKSMLVAGSLS